MELTQVTDFLRQTVLNPVYGVMSLEQSLWFCSVGFAFAFFLQSLEYYRLSPFIARFLKHDMSFVEQQQGCQAMASLAIVLSSLTCLVSVAILIGLPSEWMELILEYRVLAFLLATLGLLHLWWIWRMKLPFGGGSDYMMASGLLCLTVSCSFERAAPYAMAYLGVQTFLSYFLAGWVKLRNKQWWKGEALRTVLLSSQYRAPLWLRQLFERRAWPAQLASWATLVLELAIGVVFFTEAYFLLFLVAAFLFHLLNFAVFGLNRFVWAWVAAFPALLYLRSLVF